LEIELWIQIPKGRDKCPRGKEEGICRNGNGLIFSKIKTHFSREGWPVGGGGAKTPSAVLYKNKNLEDSGRQLRNRGRSGQCGGWEKEGGGSRRLVLSAARKRGRSLDPRMG
jgi:hypothetical protein